VYAAVAGAGSTASSSVAVIPQRSANPVCSASSSSSTPCVSPAKRRMSSSRVARAAPSASRRPYSIRNR
jgi:hypothetical protein